jgi:predicted  nucleic acid-binding Zn-ribbon protein
VKALPEFQKALLGLQSSDNHVAQLAHAREAISERKDLALVVAQLREFSQLLVARNGVLEDARLEMARIDDDVKVVDERIARDTDRIEHSSSVRDVQALEAELASLATRKNNLEESELVVMQTVEDAEALVAQAVAERDIIEVQRRDLAAAVSAREAELDAERVTELDLRARIVESLPADLVALYEKQRARYGVGAALLTRGVSGGSGMKLNETDLNAIRNTAADEVVMCPDSSCILVRTEESGL